MPPAVSERYSTDNMALAAYLCYLDHELLGLEWEQEVACYFNFKDGPDLRTAIADFWGDEATVNPQRYNNVFSRLKKRVFEEHPNPPRRRRRSA